MLWPRATAGRSRPAARRLCQVRLAAASSAQAQRQRETCDITHLHTCRARALARCATAPPPRLPSPRSARESQSGPPAAAHSCSIPCPSSLRCRCRGPTAYCLVCRPRHIGQRPHARGEAPRGQSTVEEGVCALSLHHKGSASEACVPTTRRRGGSGAQAVRAVQCCGACAGGMARLAPSQVIPAVLGAPLLLCTEPQISGTTLGSFPTHEHDESAAPQRSTERERPGSHRPKIQMLRR